MCVSDSGDSETPSSTPAADSETDETSAPCTSCSIASQTVSTARANRARTRIGVAERVTLTVSPSDSVTWSVAGGGTLSSTSGASVTYTAPDRAATPTITATVGAATCTISFEVVEPNGAYQVQHGTTFHNNGTASAGFAGITYLEPRDVSFEYIEINEGNCPATATGCYSHWNNMTHPAWPAWASVGGGSNATGSVVEGPNHDPDCTYWDYVYSGDVNSPYTAGEFTWPIPWEFRVNGGAAKQFTTLRQHAECTVTTGQVTISKGGITDSAMPADATHQP